MTIEESHRVGVFLLTQLHEALTAQRELADLREKYQVSRSENEEQRQELSGLQRAYDEVARYRDLLIRDVNQAGDESDELRTRLDQAQERAKLDSEMIAALSVQLESLAIRQEKDHAQG